MVPTGRSRPAGPVGRIGAAAIIAVLITSCAARTPAADRPEAGPPDAAVSVSDLPAELPATESPANEFSADDPAVLWNQAPSATPAPPLLILRELTQQQGDWPNTDAGGDVKMSLLNGLVELDPAASAPAPPAEAIAIGGVERVARVQTAQETAQAMTTDGGESCPECAPIRLVDPQLTAVEVPTILGPATVPAWSFQVDGTDVRLIRVAVDPAEFLTVDGLEYGPIGGDTTAEVLSDRRIRVTFFGSPSAADLGPCGQDYSGGSAANGRVVTIHIVALPNPAPTEPDLACPAIGAMRTVEIDLAEPLADRVLITEGAGFGVSRT